MVNGEVMGHGESVTKLVVEVHRQEQENVILHLQAQLENIASEVTSRPKNVSPRNVVKTSGQTKSAGKTRRNVKRTTMSERIA